MDSDKRTREELEEMERLVPEAGAERPNDPPEVSPPVDPGVELRADTFYVYTDAAGEGRWRRHAPNGEPVADSAEGYAGGLRAAHEAAIREAAGVVPEPLILIRDPRDDEFKPASDVWTG